MKYVKKESQTYNKNNVINRAISRNTNSERLSRR